MNFTPSGSTYASAIGGALTVVLIAMLHQGLHWNIDVETGAAISVLCSALVGYLPASGRSPPPVSLPPPIKR